jgi:hypothetical protein
MVIGVIFNFTKCTEEEFKKYNLLNGSFVDTIENLFYNQMMIDLFHYTIKGDKNIATSFPHVVEVSTVLEHESYSPWSGGMKHEK